MYMYICTYIYKCVCVYVGGDVIKFAGDALLVLFASHTHSQSYTDIAATGQITHTETGTTTAIASTATNAAVSPPQSLSWLVQCAAHCAQVIHEKFSGFQPTDGVTLTVYTYTYTSYI